MSKLIHNIKSIKDLDIYQENELRKELGGIKPFGFYRYYFNELPQHATKIECFNHVNELYFDLFGEYRYEEWNSFRNQYNRHLKNK